MGLSFANTPLAKASHTERGKALQSQPANGRDPGKDEDLGPLFSDGKHHRARGE